MDFIGFEPAPELRAYLNVGFPWDLMTGDYVPGVDGEEILNGGLMPFTGFAGGGNMYKSTLAHYQLLTAISRYTPIKAMSFDTEPPSCSYRRFGSRFGSRHRFRLFDGVFCRIQGLISRFCHSRFRRRN